jgi:hypothetical protein
VRESIQPSSVRYLNEAESEVSYLTYWTDAQKDALWTFRVGIVQVRQRMNGMVLIPPKCLLRFSNAIKNQRINDGITAVHVVMTSAKFAIGRFIRNSIVTRYHLQFK